MWHLTQIYIFPWCYNTNKFSTEELQALVASLRGPTDSPPKFIPAQACSLNHDCRHNKFEGSFLYMTVDTAVLPSHGMRREARCLGTHKYFTVWKTELRRRKPSRSTGRYFSNGLSSIHKGFQQC